MTWKRFMGLSFSAAALCRHLGQARLALAAILGKIAKHRIHAVILCTVDQIPANAFLTDQVSMHQFLQMKRQGVRRNAQGLHQGARGQARLPCNDKRTKNLQTRNLRKRSQSFDNGGRFVGEFHVSIILELWNFIHLNTSRQQFGMDGKAGAGETRRSSKKRSPRRSGWRYGNNPANAVKTSCQAVLIAAGHSPLRYFRHIVSYSVSRWRV
jgi:hypothetical protein